MKKIRKPSAFLALFLVMVTAALTYGAEPAATAPNADLRLYATVTDSAALVFKVFPAADEVRHVLGAGFCGTERPLPFIIRGVVRPKHGARAFGTFQFLDSDPADPLVTTWNAVVDPQRNEFQLDLECPGKSLKVPVAAVPAALITKMDETVGFERKPAEPEDVAKERKTVTYTSIDDKTLDPGQREYLRNLYLVEAITAQIALSPPVSPSEKFNAIATPDPSGKPAVRTEVSELFQGLVKLVNVVPSSGEIQKKILDETGSTLLKLNIASALGDVIDISDFLPAWMKANTPKPTVPQPSPISTPTTTGAPTSASGAPTPASPKANERTMPHLVGRSFDSAMITAWQAGLNPAHIVCLGNSDDPAKAEKVVAQEPSAGAPHPANKLVKIVFWAGPAPKEPEPPNTLDPGPVATGFQPGDGTRIDPRLTENENVIDGTPQLPEVAPGKGTGYVAMVMGDSHRAVTLVKFASRRHALDHLQMLTKAYQDADEVRDSPKGEGIVTKSRRNYGPEMIYTETTSNVVKANYSTTNFLSSWLYRDEFVATWTQDEPVFQFDMLTARKAVEPKIHALIDARFPPPKKPAVK